MDKIIYVLLRDGKRHAINNKSVFAKHGYSFDSVSLSQDSQTTDYKKKIPLGEDVV